MILLVDSLSRLAESFGDADGAKELFDDGRAGAASGRGLDGSRLSASDRWISAAT